jgi:hypothetical protein
MRSSPRSNHNSARGIRSASCAAPGLRIGASVPLLLAVCLALFVAQPLTAAPGAAPVAGASAVVLPVAAVQSIFHIEKSENKNQVHYALNVDRACRPVGPHPVYGYWRDLEKGPKAVSPLLDHEQRAYGLNEPRAIRVDPNGGEIRISLRGLPERHLVINVFRVSNGCAARTTTTILGQPALLTSIYVDIGFLFSVNYVIVRGVRVRDGKLVQEKVHD